MGAYALGRITAILLVLDRGNLALGIRGDKGVHGDRDLTLLRDRDATSGVRIIPVPMYNTDILTMLACHSRLDKQLLKSRWSTIDWSRFPCPDDEDDDEEDDIDDEEEGQQGLDYYDDDKIDDGEVDDVGGVDDRSTSGRKKDHKRHNSSPSKNKSKNQDERGASVKAEGGEEENVELGKGKKLDDDPADKSASPQTPTKEPPREDTFLYTAPGISHMTVPTSTTTKSDRCWRPTTTPGGRNVGLLSAETTEPPVTTEATPSPPDPETTTPSVEATSKKDTTASPDASTRPDRVSVQGGESSPQGDPESETDSTQNMEEENTTTESSTASTPEAKTKKPSLRKSVKHKTEEKKSKAPRTTTTTSPPTSTADDEEWTTDGDEDEDDEEDMDMNPPPPPPTKKPKPKPTSSKKMTTTPHPRVRRTSTTTLPAETTEDEWANVTPPMRTTTPEPALTTEDERDQRERRHRQQMLLYHRHQDRFHNAEAFLKHSTEAAKDDDCECSDSTALLWAVGAIGALVGGATAAAAMAGAASASRARRRRCSPNHSNSSSCTSSPGPPKVKIKSKRLCFHQRTSSCPADQPRLEHCPASRTTSVGSGSLEGGLLQLQSSAAALPDTPMQPPQPVQGPRPVCLPPVNRLPSSSRCQRRCSAPSLKWIPSEPCLRPCKSAHKCRPSCERQRRCSKPSRAPSPRCGRSTPQPPAEHTCLQMPSPPVQRPSMHRCKSPLLPHNVKCQPSKCPTPSMRPSPAPKCHVGTESSPYVQNRCNMCHPSFHIGDQMDHPQPCRCNVLSDRLRQIKSECRRRSNQIDLCLRRRVHPPTCRHGQATGYTGGCRAPTWRLRSKRFHLKPSLSKQFLHGRPSAPAECAPKRPLECTPTPPPTRRRPQSPPTCHPPSPPTQQCSALEDTEICPQPSSKSIGQVSKLHCSPPLTNIKTTMRCPHGSSQGLTGTRFLNTSHRLHVHQRRLDLLSRMSSTSSISSPHSSHFLEDVSQALLTPSGLTGTSNNLSGLRDGTPMLETTPYRVARPPKRGYSGPCIHSDDDASDSSFSDDRGGRRRGRAVWAAPKRRATAGDGEEERPEALQPHQGENRSDEREDVGPQCSDEVLSSASSLRDAKELELKARVREIVSLITSTDQTQQQQRSRRNPANDEITDMQQYPKRQASQMQAVAFMRVTKLPGPGGDQSTNNAKYRSRLVGIKDDGSSTDEYAVKPNTN